jgi:hypothetical protein
MLAFDILFESQTKDDQQQRLQLRQNNSPFLNNKTWSSLDFRGRLLNENSTLGI